MFELHEHFRLAEFVAYQYGEADLEKITEISQLREDVGYVIADGPHKDFVFVWKFGHKRRILLMKDYHVKFGSQELVPISEHLAATIPMGPYVPRADHPSLETLLSSSDDFDLIKEVLCEPLTGHGYEIGAGRRPAAVPIGCKVTYIDRFAHDQIKDGSFAAVSDGDFVKVSYFEPMDNLVSIKNESASFFIAVHVIEHVPNVIAAIKEVYRKLSPGGVIVLIVPDQRHTFDAERPTTSLEHFVAEESAGATTLEHCLEYSRRVEHASDWRTKGIERSERLHDLHYHCFTPTSMRELLSYLNESMSFADVSVMEHAIPDLVKEFYVKVKKGQQL